MKRAFTFATALLTFVSAHAAPATDTISTKSGAIKITALFHASTQIEYGGKVILVDPIGAGTYRKKADLVLITHSHGDHFDPKTLVKVSKAGTEIVAPIVVNDVLGNDARLKSISRHPIINGSWMKVGGVTIEAVPAYNIVRGPKKGAKFHPRGVFNGYVLTLGGKKLYFAGDTEFVPEMKKLKGIDAAFLPMNLPYTMTPAEAVKAAKSFKPKIVYPYHFRYPFDKPSGNAEKFAAAMKGSGIKVKILDWYSAAAVKKATKK